jgi:hypothetical protein
MTWICPIPGADATTAAWHLALHIGLAAVIVVAGVAFLTVAVVAYRRPVGPVAAVASPRR